jgi:hypothetical protein
MGAAIDLIQYLMMPKFCSTRKKIVFLCWIFFMVKKQQTPAGKTEKTDTS